MRFRGLVYVLAGQRLCEHLAPPIGASYRHILSQSHTKKSENNRGIIGGPQIIFRFRREVSRIYPGGPARPALPNQMDRHTEPALVRRSGSAPGGSDRGDRWHRLCPCGHLFAALNVLDGTVIGRNMQRHRHQEFMRFLNAIEADKTLWVGSAKANAPRISVTRRGVLIERTSRA